MFWAITTEKRNQEPERGNKVGNGESKKWKNKWKTLPTDVAIRDEFCTLRQEM